MGQKLHQDDARRRHPHSGEIEERIKALQLREGINIDATTWAQIVTTVLSLGLSEAANDGLPAAGSPGISRP
jgi:LDH2 family malate/lactate/ureidoglycolate dehydrogenase